MLVKQYDQYFTPKLRNDMKYLIIKLGVPFFLGIHQRAIELIDNTPTEKKGLLEHFISTTASVIEEIPHWSGHKVSAHAGITDGNPFIVATCGCDEEHYISWYGRPVICEGVSLHEISYGWYEDGRDRV
ncbi:hypothetical protein [Paenibacillus sp. EKM205P]|uniref:hypothetical protein n=1 Tax=Paenibacillus sp. EKM205P TaxID=1683673 RepID=UPI0013EB9838|nr:hypothetical protein [Paenibacillus sp. EKM205P]KAF6591021.1 hypothetical protein G9G52_01190 [Paenibacillus sp. EKM205P]